MRKYGNPFLISYVRIFIYRIDWFLCLFFISPFKNAHFGDKCLRILPAGFIFLQGLHLRALLECRFHSSIWGNTVSLLLIFLTLLKSIGILCSLLLCTSGSVNLCIIHWTGPSKKECDELLPKNAILKFMFSKKATKIDEIFTVYLTLTT